MRPAPAHVRVGPLAGLAPSIVSGGAGWAERERRDVLCSAACARPGGIRAAVSAPERHLLDEAHRVGAVMAAEQALGGEHRVVQDPGVGDRPHAARNR